VTVLNDKRSD